MATPPPCRRHPSVSIRRVQSERKFLGSWAPLPLQPHMVGMSQGVLHGYYPLAGQPMLVMTPQLVLNPPSVAVVREEEVLAQERLATFLVGETPPHRPRSLLSYPDSHVYESLISQMSDLAREEICIDTKPENPNSEDSSMPQKKSCERCLTCKKIKVPKVTDIPIHEKPESDDRCVKSSSDLGPSIKLEKDMKKAKLKSSSTESIFIKKDPPAKSYVKKYQKLLSLFRFRKKAPVSDIYEEIPITKSSKEQTEPVIQKLPDLKDVIAEIPDTSTSTSTKSSQFQTNLPNTDPILMKIWETNLLKSKVPETKISEGTFVISKTKNQKIQTDKSTQVSLGDFDSAAPDFSTLDPLRPPSRGSNLPKAKMNSSRSMLDLRKKGSPPETDEPMSEDSSSSDTVPPLVINFDSESSEEDSVGMKDNSWSSQSTDSCVHSSEDFCSLAHKNSDSFVFVYKMKNRTEGTNLETKIQERITSHLSPVQVMRGGSSGLGSSGSEFSSDGSRNTAGQEDDPPPVSFTEPCFNNSGLSVGSKGHLQFDYSWSWNHLNNYVRMSTETAGSPMGVPHFLRSAFPWETYPSQLIV